MPELAGNGVTSFLRAVAIAALALAPVLFAAPALADDFIAKCLAYATSANSGTPPDNIEKICTCVEGKLNASEQTTSLEFMQQSIDADKAGEEPPQVAADKNVVLSKLGESAKTCREGIK